MPTLELPEIKTPITVFLQYSQKSRVFSVLRAIFAMLQNWNFCDKTLKLFITLFRAGSKVSLIIVVEGISAAGKTTWCRQHAAQYLIKESYPENRPDRHADAVEAGRLWTEWNAKRWSDAVAMERAKGAAVCDTDPLKLHFSWALWQTGEAREAEWLAQLEFTREAIRNRRLGFADRYLFKRIDPLAAQQQRDGDTARPRPNFGLHLRLHSSLVRWYETIAELMPERVVWELPQMLPPTAATGDPHRYDLALFDRFIGLLPRAEQRP
ncbi:hypothetical protein [Rhizobium herbae]|uniref:Thymidylate kinase n=1 Tax=Rhizobium herbae TaxID=508661 RepID=A0ABS4EW71_9HYPH|nr:hypothetical protein [Rhizobium herbae]MBP1862199.1 hypothetical protein [Rhizobium herbae]